MTSRGNQISLDDDAQFARDVFRRVDAHDAAIVRAVRKRSERRAQPIDLFGTNKRYF